MTNNRDVKPYSLTHSTYCCNSVSVSLLQYKKMQTSTHEASH